MESITDKAEVMHNTDTGSSREMIYSVLVHDIKNSFMSILGLSQIISAEALTIDRNELAECANNLYRAAQKVSDSMNKMLEWSGLYSGSVKDETWSGNVYNIINESCDLLEPVAEMKEIDIYNLTDHLLAVETDWNVVSVILRNLIANSIKYSKRGASITVTGKEYGDELILCVIDSGVGMTEEQIHNLISDGKAHSTRGTENEAGTGLGMMICKDLTAKLGGKISMKSRRDIGTLVEVRIPLSGSVTPLAGSRHSREVLSSELEEGNSEL